MKSSEALAYLDAVAVDTGINAPPEVILAKAQLYFPECAKLLDKLEAKEISVEEYARLSASYIRTYSSLMRKRRLTEILLEAENNEHTIRKI